MATGFWGLIRPPSFSGFELWGYPHWPWCHIHLVENIVMRSKWMVVQTSATQPTLLIILLQLGWHTLHTRANGAVRGNLHLQRNHFQIDWALPSLLITTCIAYYRAPGIYPMPHTQYYICFHVFISDSWCIIKAPKDYTGLLWAPVAKRPRIGCF